MQERAHCARITLTPTALRREQSQHPVQSIGISPYFRSKVIGRTGFLIECVCNPEICHYMARLVATSSQQRSPLASSQVHYLAQFRGLA